MPVTAYSFSRLTRSKTACFSPEIDGQELMTQGGVLRDLHLNRRDLFPLTRPRRLQHRVGHVISQKTVTERRSCGIACRCSRQEIRKLMNEGVLIADLKTRN